MKTDCVKWVSIFVIAPIGWLSAAEPKPPVKLAPAGNAEVEKYIKDYAGKGAIGDDSKPTPPAESMKLFQLPDDLAIDLMAAEPTVEQPLYLSFDHRGRMWVVQYRQYPFPAGLKVLKYDQYLRAVFDQVPAPPPHHTKGLDKITVFEDTNGDGTFDRHTDVISDLNIVSAVLTGEGGIWVLNPPYLMFYPDADHDDVPDRDPEVRLAGFGLEDTHSVANSLQWGPDGWLYGANGSTTTGNVSSEVTKNVQFQGQCIWRYHPRTKVFEIFAEGGGNTFSLDFDSQGRAFSGTNGGGTRGMYYPQGSYGIKGWAKHGPLTNPYAFGWFEHMRHEGDADRFPQTFLIYEGGSWPASYHGNVIAGNALHNRVWCSTLSADTSTYRTVDRPPIATTTDRWFRPVDIKTGPDGAVYIADWYDTRLSHADPRDTWHKQSGRIYRIHAQAEEPTTHAPFDLLHQSDEQLLEKLNHPNKWWRQTVVRVLAERLRTVPGRSPTIERLLALVQEPSDPRALQALWILHGADRFDFALAEKLLAHPDEHVRRWTIRLLGDNRQLNATLTQQLVALARTEPAVQVRSQLASSAKRFSATAALPMLRELLARSEDKDDRHLPLLLWWAIEGHCGNEREQVLQFFADPALWQLPIVETTILERLMKRFALEAVTNSKVGTEAPAIRFAACERLLAQAPSALQRRRLTAGLIDAFQGRSIAGLPQSLSAGVTEVQESLGASGVILALRQGAEGATETAIRTAQDEATELPLRMSVIAALGDARQPKAVSPLLGLVDSKSLSIKRAALEALLRYDDPQIGVQICARWHSAIPDEQDLRSVALRLLAARPDWSRSLLKEIDESRISPRVIPTDVIQQLRLHADAAIQASLDKHFGKTRATPVERQAQMDRTRRLIRETAQADEERLHRGQTLFTKSCGVCHTLFGAGGRTGPNLTGYERDNLDFLLLSVIDPSAAIREEFTQFRIATKDGLSLTGLIDEQTATSVTLRGANNQTTVLNRDDIEVLQAMDKSIMPDGLLDKLTDDEIRDLFAYFMTRTPPKPQ